MNEKELLDNLAQAPSPFAKVGIFDIDGILRSKLIHRDKLRSGLQEGLGFCDVVFGWDANDQAYDNAQVTGWHTGYPDQPAQIDLSTYRTIPWEEDLPFFIADFRGINHPACPRNLLQKIIQQATEQGYQTRFAQEFEWFNFRETSAALEARAYHQPQPITTGMFGYSALRFHQEHPYVKAIYSQLLDFDIPLEGFHTETGPGVYEAAIRYTTLLEAADRAALFKTAVKAIAYQHGYMASFMAKWHPELPGCSGHIHQSLWDEKEEQNLFADPKKPQRISPLMEHYLAGQLYCLPHILPLYAPTINSYKRLTEGAWAPTTFTWGLDNRTVAFRVLNSSSAATRLETRVPGADTNPYLALAAALASGLYGIKHQLPLQAPTTGNGYEAPGNRLARTLGEATQAMKESPVAKELFGEAFVDHFVRTREWEWRQYCEAITDWELKRYFEII